MVMKTIKVTRERGQELTLECPECDYWENSPDDIPRRKLDIVDEVSDDGRYTKCTCPLCHHQWRLDWNEVL
jgi:hypothetical protein